MKHTKLKYKMSRWIAALLIAAGLFMGENTGICRAADTGGTAAPDSASHAQEQTERLPGVSEELQNHPVLRYRGYGDCGMLQGRVAVLTLFADDAVGKWSEADREKVISDQADSIARMQEEAARLGIELELLPQYQEVYVPNQVQGPHTQGFQADVWTQKILDAAGLPDSGSVTASLKEQYNADEAVVMFYTNTMGVSIACTRTLGSGFEYTVMCRDTAAFSHELLHVFGAHDLYAPDEVQQAAETYLGESIMADSSVLRVDALTAYLIGWTDTLDNAALQFLNATAHLTAADYDTAEAARPMDGYGAAELSNGTYEGDFLNGKFHGQGTYTWSDGSYYSGQWVNNKRTGQGTYCWADGAVYKGRFLDGQRHGYGIMQWPDGSSYEGHWKNGGRSGYGTMRWANGNCYQGNWADDDCSGYGSFTWAAGGSYEGNWQNGKQHGYGVTRWADGSAHTGYWANGQLHGYGTYTYADGTVLTGYWENGVHQ